MDAQGPNAAGKTVGPGVRPWGRRLRILTALALSALLAGFAWADYQTGLGMVWWVQLYFAVIACLIALPAMRYGERRAALIMVAIVGLGLLGLGRLDTMARKPFMRFADDVHAGMARHEVLARLDTRFPPGGRFPRPQLAGGDGSPVMYPPPEMAAPADETLFFTLDPDDGRFNSEWFVVYLREGRVVGEDYSAD